MTDVIAGGPGFVSVGADPAGNGTDAAVWHSADGKSWLRVVDDAFLELGPQVLNSVAERGPGAALYAAGWDDAGAMVWASPDGFTWARIGSDAFEAPTGVVRIEDLAPLGTRDLVAVGHGPSSSTVWLTSNGAWSRHEDDGRWTPNSTSGGMMAVTRSLSGLVSVGATFAPETGTRAAVWTSVDGTSWTAIESPAFGGGSSVVMLDVAAAGPGIVAVGLDDAAGDNDAAVWTSVDGSMWTRAGDTVLEGPGHQVIESVASLGSGLIAVGHETLGDETDPAVWVSSDGATWERILDAAFLDEGQQSMHGVVVTESLVVAVGFESVDGSWAPAVWIAEVTDVTAKPPPAGPADCSSADVTPFLPPGATTPGILCADLDGDGQDEIAVNAFVDTSDLGPFCGTSYLSLLAYDGRGDAWTRVFERSLEVVEPYDLRGLGTSEMTVGDFDAGDEILHLAWSPRVGCGNALFTESTVVAWDGVVASVVLERSANGADVIGDRFVVIDDLRANDAMPGSCRVTLFGSDGAAISEASSMTVSCADAYAYLFGEVDELAAPELVLREDGLGAIAFGDPMDSSLALLTDLLGATTLDITEIGEGFAGGHGGADEARFVAFGTLFLTFLDVSEYRSDGAMHLAGWTLNDDGAGSSPHTTEEGISLGSTVAELQAAFGGNVSFDLAGGCIEDVWTFSVSSRLRGWLTGAPGDPASEVSLFAAGAESAC